MLSLTAKAQKASDAADIERLTKVMYQFFSTDSVERFMSATDSLKALCLKTGDEVMFYKAWSNQATFNFTKVSREKGLSIAKEERTYAEQHDSKYGLYSSTECYATLMSSIGMIDESEKGFLQAIDYQRRFFPNENAAFEYIGLAKIEHNRRHYDKTVDYAEKVLSEKNVQPIHQLHGYNYLCAGLAELAEKKPDDASLRKRFNKAYAERKALMEKHQLSDAMGGIVNFYEARVNGRYSELPELATKVVTKSNRLAFIVSAWSQVGDYKKAYEAFKVFKEYTDSVNRAEIGRATSEYGVQLDLAKAENEMKDLRLANQEHREHIHHIIMGTIGAIAALIIAFLLFYLHRRNKHTKEIEAAYDQLETAHEKLETAHEKLEDAYNRLEVTTAAKERIESELRIAREIQMGMVPRIFPAFPDREDIDLYASITPAKEVGGDLYDFFMQSDKLYFCIGDVAGKGVPASLFMSVVVNLFRLIAKEGFPPEYIATRLNDTLASGNENGMFCTLFIGEIDMGSNRLNFCNAGHNAPLIIDRPISPNGSCRPNYIEMESNVPIGLWPNLEFVGESIENIKDRTLFLYTDGITEAENSSHEQFGEQRLYDIFKSRPFSSARQTVDLVSTAVAAFVGDAEASDDQTMLCLKMK
jgi:serine phosphatase RsbU (regulator of sigma subunit)